MSMTSDILRRFRELEEHNARLAQRVAVLEAEVERLTRYDPEGRA